METRLICVFLLSSAMAAAYPGMPSPSEKVIAQGTVELAKKLTDKAKGIRTLFLIVKAAGNKKGPPYGAQKLELETDPVGEFVSFRLSDESLTLMAGGPVPERIEIKARLDKDGDAGKDAPGDLTGVLKNVKAGSSKLKIVIDKQVR